MEAGTGIEPVFTDLQSRLLSREIKVLGAKPYQDKACTGREPDTQPEGPKNENPGALAGATGADELGISIRAEQYLKRANSATVLSMAIAACHHDDATRPIGGAHG
jgi:hypothetical protein